MPPRLLLLALLFISPQLFCLENKTGELRVSAHIFEPYVVDGGIGPPQGYAIEFIQRIFKGKLDIKVMPFTRGKRSIINGDTDIMFGAIPDDFEPGQVYYPKKHIGVLLESFFARADKNFEFRGIESLKGKKIGLVNGYAYPENFINEYMKTEAANAAYISGDDTILRSLQKVQMGRVDAYFDDSEAVSYVIRKNRLTNLKEVRTREQAVPLYFVFSIKNASSQALIEIFDREMSRMEKNGELKKLLIKHGMGIYYTVSVIKDRHSGPSQE